MQDLLGPIAIISSMLIGVLGVILGGVGLVQSGKANRAAEDANEKSAEANAIMREQTDLMRQSVETNIAQEIAAALAQFMQQPDASMANIDVRRSPIATALRDYMRGYVRQRIKEVQDKVIDPTFAAVTQRLQRVEAGLHLLEESTQPLHDQFASLAAQRAALQGIIAEVEGLRDDTRLAEQRVLAETGRNADDLALQGREITSLQSLLADLRATNATAPLHDLLIRIAEQLMQEARAISST